MEPTLPPMAGGLFFPDAAGVDDPAALTRRWLPRRNRGMLRFNERGWSEWSRKQTGTLALQAGDKIPLDTERGRHIEFDMDGQPH